MTVGERIREARKTKGLTQSGLADLLGITPALIGHYERGKRNPKIETLHRIADALGISVRRLLGPYDGSGVPDRERLGSPLFSVRLKKLRMQRSVTQEELAKNIGVDISDIERYESDECIIPSKWIVSAIGDYFSVSEEYLQGRVDTLSIENELDVIFKRQNPKMLSDFLTKYPEFISYLRAIGLKISLDSDNTLWIEDEDANSWEYSVGGLDSIRGNIEANIYYDITGKWPNKSNSSDEDND